MKIERYKMYGDVDGGAYPEEDENGTFCKYDEVATILADALVVAKHCIDDPDNIMSDRWEEAARRLLETGKDGKG